MFVESDVGSVGSLQTVNWLEFHEIHEIQSVSYTYDTSLFINRQLFRSLSHLCNIDRSVYQSVGRSVSFARTLRPQLRRAGQTRRVWDYANHRCVSHVAVSCVGVAYVAVSVGGFRTHPASRDAHNSTVANAALCFSTANSSARITEPSRTSSASRTAAEAPKNNTAATMCPT